MIDCTDQRIGQPGPWNAGDVDREQAGPVLVYGHDVGKTPWDGRLTLGEHALEVRNLDV